MDQITSSENGALRLDGHRMRFYKSTKRKTEQTFVTANTQKQTKTNVILFWGDLTRTVFHTNQRNNQQTRYCTLLKTVMESSSRNQNSLESKRNPTMGQSAAASLCYQCCNRSWARWQHQVESRWCQCWPQGEPGISATDENKQFNSIKHGAVFPKS